MGDIRQKKQYEYLREKYKVQKYKVSNGKYLEGWCNRHKDSAAAIRNTKTMHYKRNTIIKHTRLRGEYIKHRGNILKIYEKTGKCALNIVT